MPGGDRTGPLGIGPMTGRAAGFCAGYGVPGYPGPALGRGRGVGFGGGRGWRNRFYATGQPGRMVPSGVAAPYPRPDQGSEGQALESYAETLQSELDSIKRRLSEIKPSTER